MEIFDNRVLEIAKGKYSEASKIPIKMYIELVHLYAENSKDVYPVRDDVKEIITELESAIKEPDKMLSKDYAKRLRKLTPQVEERINKVLKEND
jgi:hypothetical protein